MIRARVAALVLAIFCGAAGAQAPKERGSEPRLLTTDEIIRVLPGRWEYPRRMAGRRVQISHRQ
jgi:hypothetical protein